MNTKIILNENFHDRKTQEINRYYSIVKDFNRYFAAMK